MEGREGKKRSDTGPSLNKKLLSITTFRSIQVEGRKGREKKKKKGPKFIFWKGKQETVVSKSTIPSILRVLWNTILVDRRHGFQDGRMVDAGGGANTLFARPSFKAKCTDKKVERGNSLFTAAEYIVRLLIGKANGVFKSINKRGGRNA